MDSRVAQEEKIKFSERLKEALSAAEVPTQPAAFIAAFNARADGAAVSVYAARKWLNGEAIPTHEKIVILATWLGVNAAWLRYGEDDFKEYSKEVIPEENISTPSLTLLNDIHSLPEQAQRTIRDIVDAFLKHYGTR